MTMGKDAVTGLKGLWIVLAFLALAAFMWHNEADASEGIEMEVGPTNLSGDWAKGGVFMLTQHSGVWAFSAGYVSEQYVSTCDHPSCKFNITPNIFVMVQRISRYKGWELGIGPTYFQNTNRALGQKFNFGLSLGYKWDNNVSIRARHWSNAGSGAWNMGQDVLTLGYQF